MKCLLDWVSSRVRHTLHYGDSALTMIGGGLEGFVEGAKRFSDWSPVFSPQMVGKVSFGLGMLWLFLHHFLPAHGRHDDN